LNPDSTLAAPVQTCPQCGEPLPPSGGYVTWCDACNWNVDPTPPAPPTTKRARKQEARRRREAEQFRDRAAGTEPLTTGERLVLGVPVLIALAILTATILLFAAGIFVLVTYPWVLGVPFGAILIGIAVLLRPRLGRVPRGPAVFRRADLPELYALLDEICRAADAEPIDVVVLDAAFNASAGKLGLRRRQVVTIGVPLWVTLEPRSRVAVLGHEVGHFVNGDLRRSLLVGASITTLVELVHALTPEQYTDDHGGMYSQSVDGFLALVAWPLRGLLSVQLKLTLRSHRIAEHRADLLGADIASTAAMVDALDTLMLAPSCERALARAADGGLWDRVQSWRDGIPPRERERYRRLGRLRLDCADTSHPPTAYRVDAVQARGSSPARVTLDPERAARLDAELLATSRTIERTLRASLPD
jgi:Zn-dependent protease with chaperone function